MITVARRTATSAAPLAEVDAVPSRAAEVDSRTRELLRGAIVPMLLHLAWPNVVVMLAQASTGLIETWWVSHLGTGSLNWLFAALAFGLIVYGVSLTAAITLGAWFGRDSGA